MKFQTKVYHPNISPQGHIVLGVDDKASLLEILRRFWKLFREFHRDEVNDISLKAIKDAEFSKIQAACDLLTCKAWRSEYDAMVNRRDDDSDRNRGQ